MATLLPNGKQTFVDANGNPLAGGTVQFYIPGTTTPKDTWQDSGQTILNTNPVTLDSAGRAIIYGSGSYRQIVKDSAGNTIWDQVTADTSAQSISWGGTSGGTANAQTVTASAFTGQTGQSIAFVAGFSNTGAATLNPNGTGALSILKDTATGTSALTGGEIFAGNIVNVTYDSVAGGFHLTTPTGQGAPATLASASTVNLGSAKNNVVYISGTTTITSFGSSASLSSPVYVLIFQGSLTLTHNATSLICPGGANIQTSAGDSASLLYLGSGNWRIIDYQSSLVAPFGVPTGTMLMHGAATAPTGYLECNGAAISRTTYAALYAVIGTNYGTGDGSTTFNIPDMRGYFPRGWDHGSGVDSGRTLGSTQADAYASHNHTINISDPGHTHTYSDIPSGAFGGGSGGIAGSKTTGTTNSATTGITATSVASGGSETRPKNVSVMFVIKT